MEKVPMFVLLIKFYWDSATPTCPYLIASSVLIAKTAVYSQYQNVMVSKLGGKPYIWSFAEKFANASSNGQSLEDVWTQSFWSVGIIETCQEMNVGACRCGWGLGGGI